MWVIRTLAEIAEADRKARSRRLVLALSIGGTLALAAMLSHEVTGLRREVALGFVLTVIGGTVFLATQRRKPSGVICKECERVYASSPRLLCPCGGRLFEVRELKWVESGKIAKDEVAADSE